MRLNKTLIGAAATSALFASLAQAQGLAAVGPTSPANGFPEYYEDTNGLRLDLCTTDPLLCLLDAPITLTNPAAAFPDNYGGTFPDELFWQRCDAIMPTNNGGQALLVMAVEAAFVNAVQTGDQIAFARLRLRLDNLVAGATYTATTPFGVFSLVAASSGLRGINFTEDIGIAPGVFTGALAGRHGPWLQWDSGLPILDAAGRQYVGNPGIEHTITGSPFGTNFFRVDGPSVGGPGINRIETNQFLVMGLKSVVVPPPAPVANFTSAPNSGTAPLNVVFTDTSTGATSWSWSFGDGTSSTLQNPSHSYAAGTYSVSLTATGTGGSNTLTKTNLVVVTPPVGNNNLVLALPIPGTAGVPNTLTVTGCTPGRTVGVFTGQVLGAGIVNQGNCGGIAIGLARPFRLAGRANANAGGTAVISVSPPATSAGRLFHFQAVETTSCRVSSL